eukprot:g19678.t1
MLIDTSIEWISAERSERVDPSASRRARDEARFSLEAKVAASVEARLQVVEEAVLELNQDLMAAASQLRQIQAEPRGFELEKAAFRRVMDLEEDLTLVVTEVELRLRHLSGHLNQDVATDVFDWPRRRRAIEGAYGGVHVVGTQENRIGSCCHPPPNQTRHRMTEGFCFEYKNTFISFSDLDEQAMPKKRAVSVPPYLGFTCPEEVEETSSGDDKYQYVSTLFKRSEQLAMHEKGTKHGDSIAPHLEVCSTASPLEGVSCKSSEPHPASVHLARDDEESTPRAGRAARTAARGGDLNPGSVGHPEVCNRPCIFFAAGNCQNGEGCPYCHLDHAHRPPHLDKKQRMMMLALHPFHGEEAAELLSLVKEWEERCQMVEGAVNEQSKREFMKLHYFLRKLTYTGLVGLAIRHFETLPLQHHPDCRGFPERITEALKQIRQKLAGVEGEEVVLVRLRRRRLRLFSRLWAGLRRTFLRQTWQEFTAAATC